MKFVPPLSDPEIHTLTDMQRFHPSRRARMRAHGLLLSHQGFSIRRIADVYQVSRYAVAAWLERWNNAGLVGLYDAPRPGRPLRLTPEEQQKVEQYLQEHPKELKRVVQRLEQDTNKRVSPKTIKRLIKKNATDGNGCAQPRPNPRSLKNINVRKPALRRCKHENARGNVLCGTLMPAAFVCNRVFLMPGNPSGQPWHCRSRLTTNG
jgi:transposase